MTDVGLVAKKLVRIETCLRDLAAIDPARIEAELVYQRFAEHTLQIAIQAAVDVAAHIVADDHLGDVASNHALFDLIARAGWLAPPLVPVMHRMVGFRNIVVHEYEDVDVTIVREIVSRRLGDLQTFVDAIRAKISG
jgi:uncharacterized protein YutE (UPF0331/DUF86 family)